VNSNRAVASSQLAECRYRRRVLTVWAWPRKKSAAHRDSTIISAAYSIQKHKFPAQYYRVLPTFRLGFRWRRIPWWAASSGAPIPQPAVLPGRSTGPSHPLEIPAGAPKNKKARADARAPQVLRFPPNPSGAAGVPGPESPPPREAIAKGWRVQAQSPPYTLRNSSRCYWFPAPNWCRCTPNNPRKFLQLSLGSKDPHPPSRLLPTPRTGRSKSCRRSE